MTAEGAEPSRAEEYDEKTLKECHEFMDKLEYFCSSPEFTDAIANFTAENAHKFDEKEEQSLE